MTNNCHYKARALWRFFSDVWIAVFNSIKTSDFHVWTIHCRGKVFLNFYDFRESRLIEILKNLKLQTKKLLKVLPLSIPPPHASFGVCSLNCILASSRKMCTLFGGIRLSRMYNFSVFKPIKSGVFLIRVGTRLEVSAAAHPSNDGLRKVRSSKWGNRFWVEYGNKTPQI